MHRTYTLVLQCADRPGLDASVAGFPAERGSNNVDAQQFDDRQGNRFFMRIAFEPGVGWNLDDLRDKFARIGREAGMEWSLVDQSVPSKVVLLVLRFEHCAFDLLYRTRLGELPMEVVAIVSNHPRESLQLALDDAIPFYHAPVTSQTKPQQEAKIREIIEASEADLVVLARYMQILSDDFAQYLSGRCINIHHSFLPGFKGAKPYRQAHARGVKAIGATAHYVTTDLDEGPVIYQEVEPVSHQDTAEDLVREGRDIERQFLAGAVRLHLKKRIFPNGRSPVVFRN